MKYVYLHDCIFYIDDDWWRQYYSTVNYAPIESLW